MLRSYDPQIGRFLQHDPYDQFASGYVGMGNDPGNGTDPTGGVYNPSQLASYALKSGVGLASTGQSISRIVSTAVSVAGMTSNSLGLLNHIGQYNQNLSQVIQLASFSGIFDLFRDFQPQYTADFLGEAYKRNFFKNHYRSGNKYPPITRLGRIYEEAIIRSLGLQKNTKNYGGTIPDVVAQIPSQEIFPQKDHIKAYSFPKGAFVDAKFRIYVPFDDQIERMINELSSQVGGYEIDSRYGMRWRSDIKATDFGAATLILITPVNGVLDPEIVKYAKQMRVKVIQEFTEFDSANPNRMRVSGWGIELNGSGLPVEMSKYFSSSSVLINWNVR
jgi:hypothetical protein